MIKCDNHTHYFNTLITAMPILNNNNNKSNKRMYSHA